MASDPVRDPPGITIKADNWFHEGWLYGMLGLPRRDFVGPGAPVADCNIDMWDDGYKTATETLFKSTVVSQRMFELGQLSYTEHRR